jgi:hypothetical protein
MAIHEEVAGEEKEVMSDLIELRTWLDVVAEKDAEIARLKDHLEAEMQVAITAMADQNKLAAALEKIANGPLGFGTEIARKALEGK